MIKIILIIIVVLLLGGIIATGIDEFDFTNNNKVYLSSEKEFQRTTISRLSIREIDSLTAEINLPFTSKNRVKKFSKEG